MIVDPIARQEVAYRARHDIAQTLRLRADEMEAMGDLAVAKHIRFIAETFSRANLRADHAARSLADPTRGGAMH